MSGKKAKREVVGGKVKRSQSDYQTMRLSIGLETKVTVSIECMLCCHEGTYEDAEMDVECADDRAAAHFFKEGWREMVSEQYNCTGAVCADCIRGDSASDLRECTEDEP